MTSYNNRACSALDSTADYSTDSDFSPEQGRLRAATMCEGPNEWTRVRHVQNRRNTEDATSMFTFVPKRCENIFDPPVPRVGAFMGTLELEQLLSELEN